MAITVRKAVPADLVTLRAFEQGVVAAERPFDSTLRAGEVRYYDLEALIASPKACLLVLQDEGPLVGCGYVRLEQAEPYFEHSTFGYVGFIYVTPDRRGQGLSGTLIRALAAWAAQRDVLELRLEVYAGNAAAMRAYEKLGFARHLITMRLRTGG